MKKLKWLLFVCYLQCSLPLNAQTILEDGITFDQSRMRIARTFFQDAYGGVTDLTFHVNTNYLSRPQSPLVVSMIEAYVFELGGRPVERNAKFQIKMERTSFSQTSNLWLDNYVIRLNENVGRSQETVASYVAKVSCSKSSIITERVTGFVQGTNPQFYKESRDLLISHCRLDGDMVQEMLLRLSFSDLQ